MKSLLLFLTLVSMTTFSQAADQLSDAVIKVTEVEKQLQCDKGSNSVPVCFRFCNITTTVVCKDSAGETKAIIKIKNLHKKASSNFEFIQLKSIEVTPKD